MNSADDPLPQKLQQALQLHQGGQLMQAQAIYEDILSVHPRHSDALNLLGAIAVQTRNLQRAVELFGKATEIDSTNVVAYCNSGWALWQLGQLDAALARYDWAIALKNDISEAHFDRGNVLRELGQPDAAVLSYQRAAAIEPDHAEAYRCCGDVLCELRQWDAALASYDRAIAIESDYVDAHFKRGNLLARSRQWAAALASYEQAIALKPDYAEAYSNRGVALKELRQRDAALASFDQAIALKADYADALCNRGNVLKEFTQWDAALASYDLAIASDAEHAEAHLNRSMMLLLRGDFDRGWNGYEWRRQSGPKLESFAQPPWLGKESIADKTILLYCEQGLGDTLQFCRYVSRVADLGARVILRIQKPLEHLLAGLPGVSQVITSADPLPEFDYHCPLLSLPMVFGTRLETIPSSASYLVSDPASVSRWKSRLGGEARPRVGLAWNGNLSHSNDHNRSMPLAELIRHLPADLQYVSLQKEVRGSDRRTLEANPGILQFSEELIDFSDTAALCDCLDVVITVDTSVAHLSAALGRPTWILLPFVPDWRWLLDREDSPWYPTVKLYRQERSGDWEGVLRRVGTYLQRALT